MMVNGPGTNVANLAAENEATKANHGGPRASCGLWTKITREIRRTIQTVVLKLALHAARYPIAYVGVLTTLSVALVVIGFFTNFRLELDVEAMLSPTGSQPAMHKDWVYSQEGFPDVVRKVALLMHAHGDNVLTKEAMERVFLGVDIIRQTEGYDDICQQGAYVDFEGKSTCQFLSASGYFEDVASFQTQIRTNADLQQALSASEFANGSPVYHDAILGNWEKDASGNLTFAESYLVVAFVPETEDTDAFEERLFADLDALRREWIQTDEESGTTILQMDMLSIYATQLEYQRAINGDLYLIAVVAIMMGSFVSITFASFGYGHPNAKSRCSLGSAAVWVITLSFVSGCGLMFICGVPFTPITQILPFVVYGIGLDDTFIIMGAYLRTDPKLDILERIRVTMEEIAHSISLTTITTVFAFLLGLRSSLPGVQWLCLYASVCILIDFLYQITLFIAFIALDEQRIQARRRDICIWMIEPETEEQDNDQEETEDALGSQNNKETTAEASSLHDHMDERAKSTPERFMNMYADVLLRPYTKGIVLVLFAVLTGCCAYSTTLLRQEFKVGDFVPKDSYLKDVLYSLQTYASVVRPIAVYFRDVDQTDPDVQAQMISYVNELEQLKELSSIEIDVAEDGTVATPGDGFSTQVKPFCWVRDFQQLTDQFALEDQPELAFLENLSFLEKLNLALANPSIREVYGRDIMRDPETGNITASRCWLFLTDLDLNSVPDQISLLHSQREVGAKQPVNQGLAKGKWAFFAYDEFFFYWESYDIAVQELIVTIVSGVVALTVISFVLIPHWSAVCFVTPMILVLYTNFLGTLQFMDLQINGIFYFCVLVSIGLLVDFLLHILMRYYETSPSVARDERVKITLETMGSSIMLGGLTTFLGVVPLCFSTTKTFLIVFKSFFAMVVLGLAHGLILMPVILSILGPTTGIPGMATESDANRDGAITEEGGDLALTNVDMKNGSSLEYNTAFSKLDSATSNVEEGNA